MLQSLGALCIILHCLNARLAYKLQTLSPKHDVVGIWWWISHCGDNNVTTTHVSSQVAFHVDSMSSGGRNGKGKGEKKKKADKDRDSWLKLVKPSTEFTPKPPNTLEPVEGSVKNMGWCGKYHQFATPFSTPWYKTEAVDRGVGTNAQIEVGSCSTWQKSSEELNMLKHNASCKLDALKCKSCPASPNGTMVSSFDALQSTLSFVPKRVFFYTRATAV